jgi:hypothetical protein
MQKALLTTVSAIALSISATAALASSSTTYDSQEGTGQVANIDQSGGNYDQVGTLGAPFDQNNGGYWGSNTIAITQTSSYNTFGVSAASFQSGANNGAIIDQYGYNSGVALQQIGVNNGAAAYGLTSGDQSNPGTALWTNSYYGGIVVQDATANSSNVFLAQSGTANIFDIGQGGYNNSVNATQTGTNELYIRQGTWLSVWYAPLGSSPGNDGTITVNQNGGGLLFNTNYAALAQGGGDANSMTVTQVGYANSVDVNQNGSNNVFSSNQTGSGNFVGGEAGWPIISSVPAALSVPISQNGTGNQYYNNQVGTNAIAMASQVGDYNYVYNYQSGNDNTIIGAQNGVGNQVSSWQTGANDALSYTQVGSNNFISNSQSGSGNTVTIKQ